jgi:hypothetical protein
MKRPSRPYERLKAISFCLPSQELLVLGNDNDLGLDAAKTLIDSCRRLRWLADLRDWRRLDKTSVRKIGDIRPDWTALAREPRRPLTLNDKCIGDGVRYETGKIVSGLMLFQEA